MSARGMLTAGLVGLVAGAAGMALADPQATRAPASGDRAAIEAVVHDYLLAHPEIIPEAMTKLHDRETAKLIDENRKAIETPYADAWTGAADGDVTLVEFVDYACGYCRASVKDVDRLLAEDKRLKVVFRELPVLGPESGVAARASLSAAKQGRFLAFHRALYAGERLSDAKITGDARTIGLDAARLAADAKAPETAAEIDANLSLAQTLGISGTPTFVVGGKLLSGAVGYDALKAAVAAARTART